MLPESLPWSRLDIVGKELNLQSMPSKATKGKHLKILVSLAALFLLLILIPAAANAAQFFSAHSGFDNYSHTSVYKLGNDLALQSGQSFSLNKCGYTPPNDPDLPWFHFLISFAAVDCSPYAEAPVHEPAKTFQVIAAKEFLLRSGISPPPSSRF